MVMTVTADTWAGSVEEMHEITVTHGVETAECQCQSCPFCRAVSGHSQVVAMQGDAALHAVTTGHVVIEHSHGSMTVGPRL